MSRHGRGDETPPVAAPIVAATVALRCAGALLQESPLALADGAVPWAALIWSTNRTPAGWARQVWHQPPDRDGWLIPAECRFGAVVEFGADRPAHRRRPAQVYRWYGIAVAHERDWLVLHGPHAHPADAERLALEWLTPARAHVIALHDPTALLPAAPEPDARPSIRRRTES